MHLQAPSDDKWSTEHCTAHACTPWIINTSLSSPDEKGGDGDEAGEEGEHAPPHGAAQQKGGVGGGAGMEWIGSRLATG